LAKGEEDIKQAHTAHEAVKQERLKTAKDAEARRLEAEAQATLSSMEQQRSANVQAFRAQESERSQVQNKMREENTNKILSQQQSYKQSTYTPADVSHGEIYTGSSVQKPTGKPTFAAKLAPTPGKPAAAPPPKPAGRVGAPPPPRAYVPEPEPEPEPAYEEPAYEEPAAEYTEEQAYEEPAAEYDEPQTAGYPQARAVYDYAAETETDLSFYAGDIINILEDSDPSGWWKGEINGAEGYFPSNFVELL